MPALPIDGSLVDLCAEIHGDPSPSCSPFSYVGSVGGVCFGIAAGNIFVCRGSKDVRDDAVDLLAAIEDPRALLNVTVPEGFWIGCRSSANEIAGRLDRTAPVKGAGHSLGGPHALYVAILLHQRGFRIQRVTVFESPRQGDARFASYVKSLGWPVVGYQNNGDLIVDLPPWGVHAETEAIPLHVPANPGDEDRVFRYHHIGLIQRGVHGLIGALS